MQAINIIHRKFIENLSNEKNNFDFSCSPEVIQQYILSGEFSNNLYDTFNKNVCLIDKTYILAAGFKKFNSSMEKMDFMDMVLNYIFISKCDEKIAADYNFKENDLSIKFFLYILEILLQSEKYIEEFKERNMSVYCMIENQHIFEMMALYDYICKKNMWSYYIKSIDYAADLIDLFDKLSASADEKCIMTLLSAYFIGKLVDSFVIDNTKNAYDYSEKWLAVNDKNNYRDYFMNYDLLRYEKGKYSHFTTENYIILYTLVKLNPIKNRVEIKNLDECISDDSLDIYNKFKYFEKLSKYTEENQISSLEFFDKKEISDAYSILCIKTNIKTVDVFFDEIRKLNLNSTEKIYLDANNLSIMINVVSEFSSSLGKKLEIKSYDYLFSLHKNRSIDVIKKAACILGKKIYALYLRNEQEALELIKKYISSLLENYENGSIEHFHIFLGKMIKASFIINDMDFKEAVIDMVFSFINEDMRKSLIIEILCSVLEVNLKTVSTTVFEKIKFCYEKAVRENSYKLKITVLYYLCFGYSNLKVNASAYSTILPISDEDLNILASDDVFITFLKYKINSYFNSSKSKNEYMSFIKTNQSTVAELFLTNLKADTFWISKLTSLEILYELSQVSKHKVFHISVHLSNILKASDSYDVRIKAGDILLKIIKYLENDELNELTVDILKGISVEENFITDTITHYLGHILLYLSPRELDECIEECIETFEQYESKTAIRILRVFCVLLENYSAYKSRFYENENTHIRRLKKIIGVFINGILSDKKYVRQQALLMLSDSIFNSTNMTYEEKYNLYNILAKKVYNVIDFDDKNKFSIYNNVVSLNNFYRFINDERFRFYNDKNEGSNKIAFFNSSFEEFTESQKSIIEQIIDFGYEIYLNPFSNDINEQNSPYFVRRKNLSRLISDDLDVYLFPKNKFINMDNNNDLRKLKSYFPNKDVSLVVGLSKLIRSETYTKKKSRDSIHAFNHIFYDDLKDYNQEIDKKIASEKNKIDGRIVNILLPKVEADFKRKHNIDVPEFIFEFIENFSENVVDEIGKYVFMYTSLFENLGEEISNKKIKFCVMRKNNASKKIIGFSAFHMIDNIDLYREFRNVKVAEYVRSESFGKLMIIDGIYLNNNMKDSVYIRELLNETLCYALNLDYGYTIYRNTLLNYDISEVYQELKLYGFREFNDTCLNDGNKIFSVSMKSPICFLCNVEKYIKSEYITEELLAKLTLYRRKIKEVLTKFYPGNLVLSLDQDFLERKIAAKLIDDKISAKKKNDFLCVSNSGLFINNCIQGIDTIPFKAERKISSNIDRIEYGGKFEEASISCQLDQIKSYDKTIISLNTVVDDSDEFESLFNLFNKKEIDVEKYFTAILSGRGRDLIDFYQLKVDYLYFIPNMKLIFREENLYPFIGGITIKDDKHKDIEAISSINEILPYTAPLKTEDVNIESIFEFSKICLENDADLFTYFQGLYINKFNRRLSYAELGNIFNTPRLPYKGEGVLFDSEKDISTYILDDKESLMRLENLIKDSRG